MIRFPLEDLIAKNNNEAIVVALAYLYSALEELSSKLDDLNRELITKI